MDLMGLCYRAWRTVTASWLNSLSCHHALLVSFTHIIHQSYVPALTPQARTDRAATLVKLHPVEAPRDHSTRIPGPLLKRIGPQKSAFKCWGTIVPFFPSLSLSFWHADHGKPGAVMRAFWIGWLNRIGRDLGGGGWRRKGLLRLAGEESGPKVGSNAEWDQGWLGLPDSGSRILDHYETKKLEKEQWERMGNWPETMLRQRWHWNPGWVYLKRCSFYKRLTKKLRKLVL